MIDYECYNKAYFYLKNKYNVPKGSLTESANKRLQKRLNKKQYQKIKDSFTDDDYQYPLDERLIIDDIDKEILKLMKIYDISLTIKKELYYKLVLLKVINDN